MESFVVLLVEKDRISSLKHNSDRSVACQIHYVVISRELLAVEDSAHR